MYSSRRTLRGLGVGVKNLTASEVRAQKVTELGLDSAAHDLVSIEAIAGALRRAASFLCPCAPSTLVRSVVGPLRGLVDNIDTTKELVEEVLESVIAHGDIIEQRELAEGKDVTSSMLLHAAPPSFVARRSGAAILLGTVTDQISALTDELESRIDYVGHVRSLRPLPGEELCNDLRQLGLIEVSYEKWLKWPAVEAPAIFLASLDRLLDSAQSSREIPGLLLLDPSRPVRYYPGRWVVPRSQTGRFVARRSQAYGAHLWSYVQMQDGHPQRMIDFPIGNSRWRACDEAWRAQLAIDAERGIPQVYRVAGRDRSVCVLELFAPLPAWARRRWGAIGKPVAQAGSLFAYEFSNKELDEERQFAREALWLKELSATVES